MTCEVTAQLAFRLFPASQRSRRGREPGVEAEIVDQTVGREPLHVTAIPFLGFPEARIEEPHLRHRERLGARRDVPPRESQFTFKRKHRRRGSNAPRLNSSNLRHSLRHNRWGFREIVA